MGNKLTSQLEVTGGSFVICNVSNGDLLAGRMYRVKNRTTEDDGITIKHVILDELFCGTTALKGKVISWYDKGKGNGPRFTLIKEEDVKAEMKRLLLQRGFLHPGQTFADVRSGSITEVLPTSRTHILVKFGKILGVKLSGHTVWFAGYKWAEPLKPELTGKERYKETPSTKPAPKRKSDPDATKFWVHTETRTQAVHISNVYGENSKDILAYWDVYTDQTVLEVNISTGRIEGRGTIDNRKAPEIVISYDEWIMNYAPKDETDELKPKTPMKTGSLEDQILAVVYEHLDGKEARQYMANNVERLLNEWGIDKNVRQLEVKVNDNPVINVGKVHFKFDIVLKCMTARTNIALVGPAGSGKTTTVAKAAEAMGLKFYSKSVSAQTGSHEFFGYQDAQGRYVRTLFREAYEFGGVFLLDEFDAGNPNVLAALNQATANGSCAFADNMIAKHDDFICVMAGNTFGHGANSDYVGRNKIDAATLDRFAFIQFPYDEDLEHALATNKEWCKKVQSLRRKAEIKKVRTVISPRATIMGGQLMESGLTEDEVMELLIFKGLNEEERNLLS